MAGRCCSDCHSFYYADDDGAVVVVIDIVAAVLQACCYSIKCVDCYMRSARRSTGRGDATKRCWRCDAIVP